MLFKVITCMLTYVHISITGKGWVYFERHMCASADWLY